MIIPTEAGNKYLSFKPREKSDTLRGCTLLHALGDPNLVSRVSALKRLRGAFTHLLVLADYAAAKNSPIELAPARDAARLSDVALRNIELLGELGFELHLALFNATAAESGMYAQLGATKDTNIGATEVSTSTLYRKQLPHELAFVHWLLAQPCMRHVTGLIPCFGGEDAAAGDFSLQVASVIKSLGYPGSILQNLNGTARTLFGPKFRRLGVLSICNLSSSGEWLRTACDVRSAIGLRVHPTQTEATILELCAKPGAVGYYMDFEAPLDIELPDGVLLAAGAVPEQTSRIDTLTQLSPAEVGADSAASSRGASSDGFGLAAPVTDSEVLWKPAEDGSEALLRLPDNTPGHGDERLCFATLACGHLRLESELPERVMHRGVPVVVYRFKLSLPSGPARIAAVRPDASVHTFLIRDVRARQSLVPFYHGTLSDNLLSALPVATASQGPAVEATTTKVPTGARNPGTVVEDRASGRLYVPTTWYTKPPLAVSYAYSISGSKRLSIPATSTSPGCFDLGTNISETSHPTGSQPNVWILKFEPHTVVDAHAKVHESGSYWYVYVENGKLRDR